MAKYTIEELYRGNKYSILSAVGAKAIRSGIDPRTADGQTWLEMELIRQTFITAEKMKQNGDCIAEGELGDAVTVSASDGDYLDRAIARLKKYVVPDCERICHFPRSTDAMQSRYQCNSCEYRAGVPWI